MTSRHLRPWLAAEGTSFRGVVDEVRQTLADELFAGTGMKMDEVTARLGYAERASFAHAFKHWRGASPGPYRSRSS